MGTSSNISETSTPQRGWFETTHWSVVLSASGGNSPRAVQALEKLCRTYWYPLYTWVRRQGFLPSDAEDLTQTFFARLLDGDVIASADQQKGRFRSFLLTRLNHFLADEWDRLKAQKRGGGQQVIPFEVKTAETRYRLEPVDLQSPDRLFEYRWAVTLLERVFKRLRDEYEREGKAALFGELKACLAQRRSAVPYAEVSARLGLSEGALRIDVHRLRQRYRGLLRAEIANTVSGPEEIEEELHYLFRVLAR